MESAHIEVSTGTEGETREEKFVASRGYDRRKQSLPFVGKERRKQNLPVVEQEPPLTPRAAQTQGSAPAILVTPNPSVRFKQIAEEHSLWSHPLVERCRRGRLTLPEVRVLGAQMYKFSHEFSRFLASALLACPHEEARVVIAENLWEELGEGELARTHPALFRRFARALGIDDRTLAATPAEPETTALIDTYLGLADQFGLAGALGAICYASEGIVAALYSHIEKGLLSAISFEKNALEFFDLHIRVDDGHAGKLEKVLIPLLQTAEDSNRVERAVQVALDARCRFFDGVLRAAERDRSREIIQAAAA